MLPNKYRMPADKETQKALDEALYDILMAGNFDPMIQLVMKIIRENN